ncbi:MAG TPA: hypothetical protein VEY12_10535 [Thermoplasmata archaeon]|nr:hypothetical protein [Thermoplasmata archaeon]
MDPEYASRDARAVEDPIAATFDLAESVNRQTPKIRRMLRYVWWFVLVWLVLDFFIMILMSEDKGLTLVLFAPVVGLLFALRYTSTPTSRSVVFAAALVFGVLQVLSFRGTLIIGTVLEVLFFLGFLILELLRDLRGFFDYFALRHRVIQRLRSSDPVVYIPEGKDSVSRIFSHLAASSPDVRAVAAIPGALATPALLTGKSGLTYSFDGYLRATPSAVRRYTGFGDPGFAIFAKTFDHTPTIADVQALKTAVADVCLATRIPPARVLAIWKGKGTETIAPDVYDLVTKDAIRVTIRGSTFVCSLELAREGEDGTYDFIPVVVEPALGLSPTPPPPAKA